MIEPHIDVMSQVEPPTQDRQRGASLVEYALLVALIAIVAIFAVKELGTTISSQFSATVEYLK